MTDPQGSAFQGRVVRSVKSLPGTAGRELPGEVWLPSSQDDVARLVARPRHQEVSVKSGFQPSAVTDQPDLPGGVVLNLAGLTRVTIDHDVLQAEVAATSGTVARQLAEHALALPLGENPHQSIASGVLNDEPSCLMRTLGRLPEFVSSLRVVLPNGQAQVLSGASALADAKTQSAIITQIDFHTASTESLWMVRWSFLYPGRESFASIARALFLHPQVPPHCDLVLDAFCGRHGMSAVRITALGSIRKDEPVLEKLVQDALVGLPAEVAEYLDVRPAYQANVIRNVAVTGYGIPIDQEIDTHRISQVTGDDDDRAAFLEQVSDQVDQGLGFRSDGKGMIDEHLNLFLRLQLRRDDRLELSGFAYTPRSLRRSVFTRSASLAAPPPAPPRRALTLPPTVAASPAMVVPAAFGLFGAAAPRIPGFQGEVYMPGDSSYRDHADQYATSSFPEADTTPFMVAYPEDVNDIQAALAFAISKNKKVVARSGGHQYCAKSSGGQSTIVLAMDTFDQFHQIDANTVDVGPAVRLTVLAARFEELEITIPHGECPLVNIGGHGQTGGYGHLARSFGLALDHIIALTIVLADGSVRTLHRPTGAPVTDDDKLFWGVLGGNAGSFGIVTNYRIRCIRDSDHPHSYGFKATRRYNQNRFADLMKQVQSWTQGVAAGVPRKGQDFMMTVESSSVGNLLPILLVELVHANLGGSVEHVDGDAVFQPIIQAAGQGFVYALLTSSGPWELSALSNAFVRRYPTTTLHGREFRFPYKKRVNCTSAALTDAFVTKLVNLVEKVVNHTNDVYLVFQMVIGGGALQNSLRRPETSIPRRDMVYCFVFDLFYDEGAEHKAEQLQQEMQEIIEAHFSPGQEQRLFWGSFGDTDMSKPQVRDYYYDDPAAYAQLRQLKQQVDPHDLFHTSFTVQ